MASKALKKAEDERKALGDAMALILFDADGNGSLNEEEQAKADEFRKRMQARRGGGRRPGGEGGRRPGGRGEGGKGGKKKPE